jgi:hypothetical protein
MAMGSARGETLLQEDLIVTVAYPDCSLATVTYAENGHSSSRKERLEILGRGHSVLIDDYRRLTIDGKAVKLTVADKGHLRSLILYRQVVQRRHDGGVDLRTSFRNRRNHVGCGGGFVDGNCAGGRISQQRIVGVPHIVFDLRHGRKEMELALRLAYWGMHPTLSVSIPRAEPSSVPFSPKATQR